MKTARLVALVVIVSAIVIVVGGVAYVYSYYPELLGLNVTSGTCPLGATASSAQGHYTIIVSNQGFNESKAAASCPTLSVAKGQNITIHVENTDTETHGFAIDQYLPGGISLQPGQSRDITFTADQVGSFKIFCNILCAAHHFQQHGILEVTG